MENLKKIDKQKFLSELNDVFIDCNLFGFICVGVSNYINDNILILDMIHDNSFDEVSIKLDLSNIGIEFGTHEFTEENEDGVFTPIHKIV
jgi:hypothetical protein